MPFNYQTLKNLTGSSVTAGSLVNANIASRTIPSGDITDLAVTSGKLASGSVSLATGVTTGVAGVTIGGTGLTSVGGANTVLMTNAANNGLEYRAVGFSGMQVFTGNSTWNRPSGVRFIRVKLVAGGGGGGGHGESGGAGGYSERVIDVTGTSSVSVTIGGGGEIGRAHV